MKKNRVAFIVSALVTAVWIAFIWINSLQVGSTSGAVSGGVTAWVNNVLGSIVKGASVPHFIIRKTGHFCEFAMLALLLCANVRLLTRLRPELPISSPYGILCAFPCAILVAAIDETIQLFVEGRVGALTDVMIDGAGALFATLLFFMVLLIKTKIKKRDPEK